VNLTSLINRVRSLTRDFSGSVFRDVDITDFMNEGIDRIKQVIPALSELTYLVNGTDTPNLIPSQYHSLLAIFSTARCFAQDERHYQATNNMNEFEAKLDEFKVHLESGIVSIVDSNNNPIAISNTTDHVVDDYFFTHDEEESFDTPDDRDLEDTDIIVVDGGDF
jgi:hypothetical protein